MQTEAFRTTRVKADDLVVALFTDSVAASDAVADLQLAGFHADRIGIALSREGKEREAASSSDGDAIAEGKHSLFWKLRHSVQHDAHAHGFGLESKTDADLSQQRDQLYSEVDLEDTLLGLGVAEERIRLLDREIGPDGMLMLVDAGHHCTMVQSILEDNRGFIRTDMATERPPAAH